MGSAPTDTAAAVAIAVVVLASMALYLAAGRLGKSSQGSGSKYAPFTGGEEIPPARGKYHSDLFVYAALFMVFEVFALLLASAIRAGDSLWPLVFTATGGLTLFAAIMWFVETGGGQLV